MSERTRLTSVDSVPEHGSYLLTVRERDGSREEVVLVRCRDGAADGSSDEPAEDDGDPGDGNDPAGVGIRAWRNYCQHETDQRLDRGFGAAMRDGEIVCPKHGSTFDACSGYCAEGKAAESYLSGVEVAVEDGAVYLVDPEVTFEHEGGIEDDDGPSSSSHLTF